MKIAINKAHYPVTVLGPGRRIGLWLQGCRIHCAGCVAQDTWAVDPERVISVANLLVWCKSVTGKSAETLEGITISGGEPFDQPKALSALLDALHLWRRTSGLPLDILCYSGYPLKTLQKRHAALLQKLDALIPEPYLDAEPLTQLWRGSANQSLILLSPLGVARYTPYLDAVADDFDKRIQIQSDGQRLWCIGLPARGDMEKLAQKAEKRGLTLHSVSWR